MKFSDIQVGYIYNVIFDPVRNCEFNGKHLALVLKRNNDKQTFIVMPLTSESNGEGLNKIKLGNLNSLPSSLRCNNTYAVYNQIRTVNANRFIALKEGSIVKQSKLDDKEFEILFKLGINELLYNLDIDKKIVLLKEMYEEACVIKAIDLAYTIIKLKKQNKIDEINNIEEEIKKILIGKEYVLEQKYIDDGILNIFENVFRK